MIKTRVLFVCVHNAARSQMAEAFLNHLGGTRFEAESAGLEPGILNPVAVAVMKEIDIDISKNETKSVFDFYKQGYLYSYVITVCDEASAESCPVFPGVMSRLHWSFEDPVAFQGTYDERLAKARQVRDRIREKVEAFIRDVTSRDSA